MIKSVENRLSTIDGKEVDVIDIKFQSGKRLKLVFNDKENHIFYDQDKEDEL